MKYDQQSLVVVLNIVLSLARTKMKTNLKFISFANKWQNSLSQKRIPGKRCCTYNEGFDLSSIAGRLIHRSCVKENKNTPSQPYTICATYSIKSMSGAQIIEQTYCLQNCTKYRTLRGLNLPLPSSLPQEYDEFCLTTSTFFKR